MITMRAVTWGMCLAVTSWCAVTPSASAAEEDFAYHTQVRDTLIAIGRRLLIEPRRWREVQSRNLIRDPNRIPQGAVLHIPYEWLRMSREMASVLSVGGVVTQSKTGVAVGDLLSPGAVIETGVDGSLTLQMADGSTVTLQKSSTLTLQEMARVTGVEAAHSIRLKLSGGRLETRVNPHRDVGRFEISTPIAVAAVRGTQFRDSYDAGDSHGTTETLEGTVGVAGAGAAVAVAAGFGTRVNENAPPLQPVPLLPPPEFVALPATHSTPDVDLQWRAVEGAGAYRVQLASDAEFHAVLSDMKVTETHAAIPQLGDGDYWIRLRAIDRSDIEGSDRVVRLTQNVLPNVAQATTPLNAQKLFASSMSFVWSREPHATTYRLQVSRDSTFDRPVIDRTDLTEATLTMPAITPGLYYWRVAAANAQGELGPWNTPRSFTQLPDPPVVDALELTAHELRVTWHAQPAPRYRVEISHDRQFKRPRTQTSVESAELLLQKPHPGIYYVRVAAIDAEGFEGPMGVPRRFVVPVPRWVEILIPSVIVLALLI